MVDPSGLDSCIQNGSSSQSCGNNNNDESLNDVAGGYGDPLDPMTCLNLNGCVCVTQQQYDAYFLGNYGSPVSGRTVGADGGTRSAALNAYFDSPSATQGDVTQEGDDAEPDVLAQIFEHISPGNPRLGVMSWMSGGLRRSWNTV